MAEPAIHILPGEQDISLVRGDSFDITVTVREGEVDEQNPDALLPPVDLTGASAAAWVRRSKKSSRVVCEFECVIDPDQVTNTGQTTVIGRDSETSKLTMRSGVWDLQVRHAPTSLYPEGRVRTYLAGRIDVTQDVSRPSV